MHLQRWVIRLGLALLIALSGVNSGDAQTVRGKIKSKQPPARRMTHAERQAAAARAKKARAAGKLKIGVPVPDKSTKASSALAASTVTAATGGTPDYFGGSPNWAISPLPTGSVSAQLASGGGGYTIPPVVTISDAYNTGGGAAATAVVTGGAVTGITITNAGSGYTAPIITIAPPLCAPLGTSTCDQAQATAILTNLTGGMRKFVDRLPGLGAANANVIGQYMPVAVPDTTRYPGSDYYEIELVQYRERMHSDLPPVVGTFPNQTSGGTLLRGYRQTNTT
jgi:hypothetical protein